MNAPNSNRRLGHHGFTLVEILVVISIMTLLMGVLIPALSRARENAKRTKCLSNVRQLQISLQLYADSDDGRIRSSADATNEGGGFRSAQSIPVK